MDLREFGRDLQNGLITIDEPKKLQKGMKKEVDDLKNYSPKSDKTKNDKNKVLKNVKLPYNGIKKVIKGFEDGDFLLKDFDKQGEKDDSEQPSASKYGQESEESEESKQKNLDWLENGTKEEFKTLKKC